MRVPKETLTMQNKNRKILFIIPDYSHEMIDKFASPTKVVPFGVLSLASYTEHYCPNTECRILDFNTESRDIEKQYALLKNQIIELQPDIVGLSIMYNASWKYIAPFAKIIKEIDPTIILVVGGIAATNMPKDVFNESQLINAICYGEGEIPFRDLSLSEDPSSTFREHPSWITLETLKAGKCFNQSLVIDLDDIPPINYSLVDKKKYTSQFRNRDGEDVISLPIHSTRGCPFNCIFCCSGTNHGKKIRSMPASRFLSDVKQMIEKYNITRLSIDDDQFLFHRDRAKKILIGLAQFHIEIEMANGLTVQFIDDEIATLLKNAGLKIAVLAIESGSQRVLSDIISKPLNLGQVRPAVKALRRQDLKIHAFFIIGFPGETPEDRQLTHKLILDIGFDWSGIFVATPFQGSRLYELCRQKHYIPNNRLTNPNIYQCQITAPGINPQLITEEAYLLNLDVNFVNNYNLHHAKYERAESYFIGITKRYPQHAFAHYFLAKAMEGMPHSNSNTIEYHKKRFVDIISSNNTWKTYAKKFKIFKENLQKTIKE